MNRWCIVSGEKKWTFFPLYTIILLRIISLPICPSLFFAPFPPRHHIIVNVFDETGYAETPSPPLFPGFFPVSSLKSFQLSYNQKSLMKPDTFDLKSPLSSCYTLILSVILLCSSFAYIQKTSENVLRIKERNIAPTKPVLNVWFIQPSTYFYHIYIYRCVCVCVCVCVWYVYIMIKIKTIVPIFLIMVIIFAFRSVYTPAFFRCICSWRRGKNTVETLGI